jgi:hypothetical protein
MTTASISGSQAALKVLYPEGELPKSINEMFVLQKRLKKETDFVGELAYVALQNANPQGSSAQFDQAQANIYQGNYLRFALQRVTHYGVARITGEAAEAAVKSEGALVDLWDNETKGCATTEMIALATYLYGTGDATLGQISSGQTTTTVTLASGTNMNYFELNMTVKCVSATGLASTVRSGGAAKARITGIDRRNRILTFSAALNTLITDVAGTDYFVRAGDEHNSGTARVITGLDSIVAGGTAPGTLWGLNRDQDPVRLAGQAIDYSGWSQEDAVVDASAQSGFQGIGYPSVLVANNIDVANMKKSMAAKLVFNRPGASAGKFGFSDVSIEGENGAIEVLADPYCPRNKAYLLRLSDFSLFSLKAAPHLAKYDGIEFLRRPDADAYEVRFAFYGNVKCKNPGPHVRLTNFGVGA